jgi:MFS family permease
MIDTTSTSFGPRLGLRQNFAQFCLLVGVNALVGGMIGQERTVLPLLAEREFHLTAFTAALTFIAAFGAVKAATNFFAGTLSDRYGRKPVLVAGWFIGIPVPLLLIWAPSWGWVIAANILLGINQGLTWSTTVIMKIDLVGPERRGFAMGINEAAGYGAVAITALATGYIAQHAGLRPEPFYLGVIFAGLGLGLSVLFVRETRDHADHEAATHVARHVGDNDPLTTRQVFVLTSFREPALSSCSQAGMVNNLNDGLAWGLFPIAFAEAGLSVGRVGILAALYPAVWGLGQLITGGLSDRMGRKPLIAGGMLTQAAAIAWIAAASGFWAWALGAIVLGAGTAMVYPTLLAAIGDVAHPSWRARSVGVYRLWRDGGFAVGALLAGVLADVVSIDAAIWAVAALTAASGVVVHVRMYETRPRPGARQRLGSSARPHRHPGERQQDRDARARNAESVMPGLEQGSTPTLASVCCAATPGNVRRDGVTAWLRARRAVARGA